MRLMTKDKAKELHIKVCYKITGNASFSIIGSFLKGDCLSCYLLTPLTRLVSSLFTVNKCPLLPTLIKEHLRTGI